MKYIFVIVLLLSTSGCTSLNKNLVQSVDQAVNIITPQYIQYVEKDETISKELKDSRLSHAKQLLETMKDARKITGIDQ